MRSLYHSIVVNWEMSVNVKLLIYIPTLIYVHELWAEIRLWTQVGEMGFFWRAAGLSLTVEMWSSVIQKEIHIERSQLRCFRHRLLGRGPGADPGKAIEIISLSWSGKVSKFPRMNWERMVLCIDGK